MTHTVLLSDSLTGVSNTNIFDQVEDSMKKRQNTDGKFDEESDRTLTESSRILVESTIEKMSRILMRNYLLRFMVVQ
jgi:hypothetical protein